jgi:hypothetical protein
MWGYVSWTFMIPKNIDEGYAALIDFRETNNTKIITWINNFVEHCIDTWLAKYDTLIPLTSIGFVVIPHLSFFNVYLILKLTLNLVYVSQLCDYSDCLVIFSLFFYYI